MRNESMVNYFYEMKWKITSWWAALSRRIEKKMKFEIHVIKASAEFDEIFDLYRLQILE